MIGLLVALPLGLLFGRRRRPRASTRVQPDPRLIAGRACCQSCARDQRLGLMEPNTSCSACAVKQSSSAPCTVMPFDVAAVDAAVRQLAGHGDADTLTTAVLQLVYPTTLEGLRLTWRALSDRDPWCLHALHHRVHARVCAALATLHDADCEQAWSEAGYPVVPVGTGGGVA